ncbi:MAG: lysine--tRNA ligase [Rhodospirillales bacterium]|nr:lysine--tRNA ligase [Rhodospirillales bacterium]
MTTLRAAAEQARAWPFAEARRLAKRLGDRLPEKGHVLFETGFGPSGLPHIGTFGEVARTTMVRRAFETLTGMPTRLIAFSDDMDGLRSVPSNVPEQAMLAEHLGRPLSDIPDPFGQHESFAAHNNTQLCTFLDRFGFDYEFRSSTHCYRSGVFDETLLMVLRHYDEITEIILPTLGRERRATYSPFLPVCPTTGRVLQAPVLARNPDAGTITYRGDDGTEVETPVTGGRCKLQWKPDWAMRWVALDVDYEMNGKDLISSYELGAQIARVLGARPPANMTYELFLDERGEKISKKIGNGLTLEEWLTYGTEDSLSLFMYHQPGRAKRLHFDVIPRHVDDYERHLKQFADRDQEGDSAELLENPVWHIHGGQPARTRTVPLTFGMLLNLASACNAEDASVLWGFIARYLPAAAPATEPALDQLVALAVRYYQDRVRPQKRYRPATAPERTALLALAEALRALPPDADGETLQGTIFEVGRANGFDEPKIWFKALYETLLGQSRGPRMGSFIALYGIAETVTLIEAVTTGRRPSDAAATPAS